jgi:ribosome maturation factor RimP
MFDDLKSFLEEQANNFEISILKFSIWRSSANTPNLDILIERKGYEPTGIAECTKIHKQINLWLKNENMLGKVKIVVRCPSIDRELFSIEDFERFKAEKMSITLKDLVDGQRNLKGFIKSIKDEIIAFENEGSLIEISLENIEKARLVPDWAKIMKESKGKN